MATSYFKVKNGIQVGPFTVDAATGNVVTSGSVTFNGDVNVSAISKNDSSIAINDTGSSSNVDIIVDGTRAVVFTGTAMLPNTDITYDLGSAELQWRDVYVGPGSLYVNGQKVLQEDSGNIVVSADANQNLVFQTSGSGNLELDPVGTGVVFVKGTLQIEAGTNITNSDGNAVNVAVGVKTDSVASKSTNTDLTLSADGNGVVRVSDDMVVTGNLTISGTTTTVNTSTLSVADNIIDLNSDVTTGSPSQNAGLRVMRGDDPAVQLRWNESTDKWELTTDGTNYSVIGDASALPGNTTIGGNLTPTSDNTLNLGSSSLKFNTVHATTFSGQATTAQYADLAENYVADKQYDAGTVVEFGGAEEVTIAAPGSTRVAGVVSTAPGFLMNAGLKGTNVVAVAFTGRVPCKVTGAVRKGDMLVASGNGHATVTRTPQIGQVIGKALANFDGQSGVIEVAVGRF